MKEMIKLFLAVFLFSVISGGVLAGVKMGTKDRIKQQQLAYVIGPALGTIFEDADNKPLEDLFMLKDGQEDRDFFVGEFEGKRKAVAFEVDGKGFGGDIGVLVAVNVETDEIVGVAVTTHSETPGLGSRTKDDPAFSEQFKGLPLTNPFKVKPDGGQIDAVSGATVSSRGVCGAVTAASEVYARLKDEIKSRL